MKRDKEEQKQVLIFGAFIIFIMGLAIIMFYAGFQAGQNL